MQIDILHAGMFKLDGGAMFGVVPRKLWQNLNPPDSNNLCTWAMRSLLVRTGDRTIVIDTGIGNKQDAKFRSHFEPHGDMSLLGSLAKLGVSPGQVTDVFLTHLHFDHVGGAIQLTEDGNPVPTFPNATYWSNEVHYNWALEPNAREKASFLQENFVPLLEWGKLQFIPVTEQDYEWLPGFKIRFLYGHTEAMMMPILQQGDKTYVYAVDLIPSSGHIGMPYVMSYDMRPLETLKEKDRLLLEAHTNGQVLIFEHDPKIQAATVKQNEQGRVILDEIILLSIT